MKRNTRSTNQPSKPKTQNFATSTSPLIWLTRHLQVFLGSLGRLSRTPLSTIMTSAVIGIALALPAGLYNLVDNVQSLAGSWRGGPTISVFLHRAIDDEQSAKLRDQLTTDPRIRNVRLIGKAQAIEEFRSYSGFGEALDLLEENPLPSVLVIRPTATYGTAENAEILLDEFQAWPESDIVQLDLQWVRRLKAITETVQRGIWILSGLLSLAVLLIIGNTIRLEIQYRRSEIEIVKLVGGTNAFIRRPFLYDGLWYGLLGGLVAMLTVWASLVTLQAPVERLAGLYDSSYQLAQLSAPAMLFLLSAGIFLGLGGAWIAVGRHLSAIEPQ